MFPWTHFGKYKGAWRFACCDAYGRRKELPFAEKRWEGEEGGWLLELVRKLIVPVAMDTR